MAPTCNEVLAEHIALLVAQQADLRDRMGVLAEDQHAEIDRLNRQGMAAG